MRPGRSPKQSSAAVARVIAVAPRAIAQTFGGGASRVPHLSGLHTTYRRYILDAVDNPRLYARSEHMLSETARSHLEGPANDHLLRALSEELGLTAEDIAQATGVSAATIRRWAKGDGSPRRDSERRLDDLRVLVLFLGLALKPRAIATWLRTTNPGLGGERPIDMLARDEYNRVERASRELLDSLRGRAALRPASAPATANAPLDRGATSRSADAAPAAPGGAADQAIDGAPQSDRTPKSSLPPWITVSISVLVALAGLVPLVLGSPGWAIAAVFSAAVAAGVVWRRGFVWPRSARSLWLVISVGILGGVIFYLASGAVSMSTQDRGDSSPATGKAVRTEVVCVDSSPSTKQVRSSYLASIKHVAREAARSRARFFAAACGGNPTGTVDWPVEEDFREVTHEAAAVVQRELDQRVLRLQPPLRGVIRTTSLAPGTPLGAILAVMGRRCGDAMADCHVWFFTDGAWQDERLNALHGITRAERKRYVATG